MTITSLRGQALAYESVTFAAQDCNIYSAVFAASVLPTLQIPSTHAGQTHSVETMSHDLYCKKCLPWVAAWTLQWAMVWRWPPLLGNRSAGSLTIQRFSEQHSGVPTRSYWNSSWQWTDFTCSTHLSICSGCSLRTQCLHATRCTCGLLSYPFLTVFLRWHAKNGLARLTVLLLMKYALY